MLVGGAGSSKSYSLAQHLLLDKCNEEDKRILVIRKTRVSHKTSCWQLMLDLLNQYHIPYQVNRSDLIIQVRSNLLLFRGLDDPEKLKSIEFGNYIWIEEATELSHDDFLQLRLRLRRRTDTLNQMFLSLNPIDIHHWIKTQLVDRPSDDMLVDFSTYQDNPFLPGDYVKMLEGLKDEDETFYQVYTLGRWGIIKNLIYSNWDVVSEWPSSFDEIIYGIDFGYNNPSCVLEIGIKDKEVYERELIYESGLTNTQLIEKCRVVGVDKSRETYADSAEPARIKEFEEVGYNIYPSEKGKDSVAHSIDYVKRQKVHIHADSVNLIAEKRSYKWKEDKNGVVLDEPARFKDHAMSAERYALYAHREESEPHIHTVDMKGVEEKPKEETEEERFERIMENKTAWN